MRRSPALLAVALSLTLVACGGDEDDGGRAAAPPAAAATPTPDPGTTTPRAPRGRSPLELPPGVPSTPRRPRTSQEDRDVITGWARALAAGDVAGAARFFARPSLVQNGTPVVRLDSFRSRVAFNLALPCGARPVRFGSGDGYSIVEFALSDRPGGDCGGATGQRARCAIKVDDGRITEWYRLPDDPADDAPALPEFDGDVSEA
ncbi:hypothetical protein [Paraconexibacter algicola]|uniref:Nuclear transport factor 2 family protein n=1 Tax=Paraconexibacter algicola TaxID=2133960 RepID=A0A2T4UMG6_9ACTN|nr:hypothetical protein [Paraconexibacter algicola]PTL60435.1 hypothetical protein C7Y72_12685 [Paraconexibacter algicola]